MLIMMLFGYTNLNAQQRQQSSQIPNLNQLFNLGDIFNMDFNDLFGQLEEELGGSSDLLGQFLAPAMVDSTLNQMKGMSDDGSFNYIFEQLQKQMGGFGEISQQFEQLLQQFDLPLNNLPLNQLPTNPDNLEEGLNNGGWQIIPDIPKEEEQKTPNKAGA